MINILHQRWHSSYLQNDLLFTYASPASSPAFSMDLQIVAFVRYFPMLSDLTEQ